MFYSKDSSVSSAVCFLLPRSRQPACLLCLPKRGQTWSQECHIFIFDGSGFNSLCRHRFGCAGSAKWHIAHKTYLLPANFMVLEERPCTGLKIDGSTKQGCCGLWTHTKENSCPLEGNTAAFPCSVTPVWCVCMLARWKVRSVRPSLAVTSENVNKGLNLLCLQVITRRLLKHPKNQKSLSSGSFWESFPRASS